MAQETILLVEDDFALAMGVEFALKSEGYEVIHAGDIKTARESIAQNPDLILLDVMLPDGNGYDFCKEVRDKNIIIPIIFLTSVAEEVNVVQGLMVGADDYVTKPFKLKELMSRIVANIRRSKIFSGRMDTKNVFVFGAHVFNKDELKLTKDNELCDLSPSELRLLRELIMNQGQILSRNQLLEKVYDTQDTFVDDNTLSVYMKRLRTKLGEDADYIETVRGLGYRFKKDI